MIALSSLSISVSHPLSLSAEPAISELVADVIKLHPYILQHMAPKSEDIRQHSPNCNYHTQKIELHYNEGCWRLKAGRGLLNSKLPMGLKAIQWHPAQSQLREGKLHHH